MRARSVRAGATPRLVAALLAVLLVALAPAPARAADETPWELWAKRVIDRPHKGEIPLAIIASFPAMVVITPFWLVQLGMDTISGED